MSKLSDRRFSVFLVLCCSLARPGFAGSEVPRDFMPERLEVLGSRLDFASQKHGGQRQIIVPENYSLYDAKRHLQQESSFLIEETSQLSSTGFAVPRVRGQNIELTEVYLEDIHLFDAYSGLPVFAELDLRAFGALEITKGLPPAMLNSLNPIGALRYRLLPDQGGKHAIGIDLGQPYGSSIWGKTHSSYSWAADRDFELRLFSRWHHSQGRFAFYDHRGTPYNEADDRIAIREQNARRSLQVLPVASWQRGADSFHLIGWWQRIYQQMPAINTSRPSRAYEEIDFNFAAFAWQHRWQHNKLYLPDRMQWLLRWENQDRMFVDPTGIFLGKDSRSSTQVAQNNGALSLEWTHGPLASYHKLEAQLATAKIELTDYDDIDLKLARLQKRLYWGAVWPITPSLTLTHKVNKLWHQDEFPRQESTQHRALGLHKHRRQAAEGGGLALQWAISQDLKLYSQFSAFERPPTILEEFGNGGSVAGNPVIKPEKLRHQEAGLEWTRGALQSYLALFRDELKNKIVFVPKYENAMIASNIARSRIQGMELGGRWYVGAHLEFTLGSTLLQPYNITNPSLHLMLPGIPKRTSTASIGWKRQGYNIQFWARQQGEFYRDQLNGRRVPESLILDLSGDFNFAELFEGQSHLLQSLVLSWQLNNIMDVKSLAVSNKGGELSQSGRIPLSSYDGAPQPGRHYKLALTASF